MICYICPLPKTNFSNKNIKLLELFWIIFIQNIIQNIIPFVITIIFIIIFVYLNFVIDDKSLLLEICNILLGTFLSYFFTAFFIESFKIFKSENNMKYAHIVNFFISNRNDDFYNFVKLFSDIPNENLEGLDLLNKLQDILLKSKDIVIPSKKDLQKYLNPLLKFDYLHVFKYEPQDIAIMIAAEQIIKAYNLKDKILKENLFLARFSKDRRETLKYLVYQFISAFIQINQKYGQLKKSRIYKYSYKTKIILLMQDIYKLEITS